MTKTEIFTRLREHEAALHRTGVLHVALFGSRARGDAHEDSDIDLLVELDPTPRISIFDYAGMKADIAALFGGKVDVVNRAALRPWLREQATAEAVYAF